MSLVRLQTPDGKDVVTVSLDDGTVNVKDPEKLTDGARAFWDAIHTVRHAYVGYNDLVLKGELDDVQAKAGDIIMTPGRAAFGNDGGDVHIHGPTALPQKGHGEFDVVPLDEDLPENPSKTAIRGNEPDES